MALRTVAAKLKSPVASLKQAWAVFRPQAKGPKLSKDLDLAKGPKLSKDLDLDLSDPQIRRILEETAKITSRKRMKETAAILAFMTGTTSCVLLAMR